jgi:hypothetical protein
MRARECIVIGVVGLTFVASCNSSSGSGAAGGAGGGGKSTGGAGATGGAATGGSPSGAVSTGGVNGGTGATGLPGAGGSGPTAGKGGQGAGGVGGVKGEAPDGSTDDMTGGGGVDAGGTSTCGPSPQCPRCALGACCGATCCGPGERCDTSGATPQCRCGASAACTAPAHCASAIGGPNICGFICCSANCPISRREFKRDIRPLTVDDLGRVYEQLRQLQLTTYQYRGTPVDSPRRLGFIIDDTKTPLPINPDGMSVDLYGYMSMAVAAIQTQSREIAELRAALKKLARERRHSQPRARLHAD